jgi:surface antigen
MAMSVARIAGLCSLALGLCLTVPASGEQLAAFYDGLVEGDRAIARDRFQDALETRHSLQAAEWHNDASGNSGAVMPVRTFRIPSGHYCREFRESLVNAGTLAERTGTACRREDGVWILVER